MRQSAIWVTIAAAGCFVNATGEGRGAAGAGGAGPTGSTAATGGGTPASTSGAGGGAATTGNGGAGGCDAGCDVESADACSAAVAFALSPDTTVTWTDTTEAAADDLVVAGLAGLACPSDGPDRWLAVRATAPGAIRFSLVPGDVDAWGASLEKAVLHVRTGCDATAPKEVLVCKDTSGPPPGAAESYVFARTNDVFYVGVDGRGNNDLGPFELEIRHWQCGNGVLDPLEQCDSGPQPSADCSGCLSTEVLDSCGADDADTFSSWNAATERCYLWETGLGDRNFFEAREWCIEQGGDLAAFDMAAEQAAFDALHALGEAWVGVEDFERDGTYDWLSGASFSGPWAAMQPDNTENKPRCAYMAWDGAAANQAEDVACDFKAAEVVCELRGANP